MITPIKQHISELRQAVRSRHTHSLEWRQSQLQAFQSMLEAHQDDFIKALETDLGRSSFISELSELNILKVALKEAIASLPSYVAPTKVSVPISVFPSSGSIVPEPLGLVLILSPWNYPLVLALHPMIGAISAGNAVILKPSEVSSASSKVLAKAIGNFLDQDAIRVVEGGVAETTELLTHKFDHIFFTGSTTVGRIVYQAAAKNLTPVTLELGGKSPVIIDSTANLRVTARRLLFGLSLNCSQICVAPDYCIVVKEVASDFYHTITEVYAEMFPAPLKSSSDYSRIINTVHTSRLVSFIEESDKEELAKRGEILIGGEFDVEDKYIEPTIFRNTNLDAKIMQDEIFGPLLPVVEVDNVDEAINIVNDRPKPLALYLFSEDQSVVDRVIQQTSSGAVSVNDVLMHFAVESLPFGGVGESGMGCYKGKASFDTFSHKKPILHQSGRSLCDPYFRYPPFDEKKQWIMKKFF